MSSGTEEKKQKAILDIPSDKEIQTLLEAAASEAGNPIDVHAQFFALYSPLIKNQLSLMGKKQIIRLVSSIIEHPLNEQEIKLRTPQEQNVFKMVDQLLQSKYFMMISSYIENQQKIEAAELAGKSEAETTIANTELTNQ